MPSDKYGPATAVPSEVVFAEKIFMLADDHDLDNIALAHACLTAMHLMHLQDKEDGGKAEPFSNVLQRLAEHYKKKGL